MAADTAWLREYVRDIADFPEPGIVFKDIAPLLNNVDAFRFAVDALADHYCGDSIDRVVGIEARGFLFAAPLAYRCGAGFVPVRKPGKLPWESVAEEYQLEYGADQLEMHIDAVAAGDRVLIVDDVLATGGTAAATVRLVQGRGATVVGLGFLLELGFLNGAAKLEDLEVFSLLSYE
ncbi:MAG: adenine phosphoribosyltransferase [Acidimicrobiales bacterium]